MRLISARIRGFGRLVDTKINLDAKVIAIVGPNEAGKTTLLSALAHVDSDDDLAPSARSRADAIGDGTTVTQFSYVLDEGDHGVLVDLDLHELPTRMTVGRHAVGRNPIVGLTPTPVKSIKPLRDALQVVTNALASHQLDDWIDPETIYADPHSDAARDYRAELSRLLEAINQACDEPGTDLDDEAVELAGSLHSVTLEDDGGGDLRAALDAVNEWQKRPRPDQEARDRLWNRTPDFILFGEEDRSVQSAYPLDEGLIQNVPPALANLAGTAGLNLPDLWRFI